MYLMQEVPRSPMRAKSISDVISVSLKSPGEGKHVHTITTALALSLGLDKMS